jgi:hypothetical protein
MLAKLQTAITTIGIAVPEVNTRDSATVQRRILPHVIQLLQYWSYVTDVQEYVDKVAYLHSLQMLGNLCSNHGKLAEAEEILATIITSQQRVAEE